MNTMLRRSWRHKADGGKAKAKEMAHTRRSGLEKEEAVGGTIPETSVTRVPPTRQIGERNPRVVLVRLARLGAVTHIREKGSPTARAKARERPDKTYHAGTMEAKAIGKHRARVHGSTHLRTTSNTPLTMTTKVKECGV